MDPGLSQMAPRYRDSWFIRAGAALLLLGSAPLIAIIVLASLGLTRDPNPNPVGPGLLFFFSFCPSLLLILIGWFRTRRARNRN